MNNWSDDDEYWYTVAAHLIFFGALVCGWALGIALALATL